MIPATFWGRVHLTFLQCPVQAIIKLLNKRQVNYRLFVIAAAYTIIVAASQCARQDMRKEKM